MKTFILFLYGMFDDSEDLEFFCTDVFGEVPKISSVRYIIEKSENVIIIFDSDEDYQTLSNELFEVLSNENVKFYFMFDRDTLVTAHLPNEVKDFIFKPEPTDKSISIEYTKPENNIMDLDQVLEKIEKTGIESLTLEEKNFLDNFDN